MGKTVYVKSRSPCMQMQMHPSSRKKPSHNRVWVPAIPSWEKDFCNKIGLFKWEDFIEAKKSTRFDNKIMEWNDAEAKAAFHRAKSRFYAKINNLPYPDHDESISGPDLYIDNIDWEHDNEEITNPGVAGNGFDEFCRGDSSDFEEEEEEDEVYVPADIYHHIKIEDIIPT
ncbi:hypothetical protein OROHE_024185 [Orobanche hederae]